MNENEEFKENSQAVQAHLSITQSVIQRMASNSNSCKGWAITIVSAILVLVADKAKPQYAYIALIPTFLFFFLDAYYLALEKLLRNSYNAFIEKLHKGKLRADDLYAVKPTGNGFLTFACSLLSLSIWPFYGTLLAMTWIAKKYLL
ncbi:MAG: hypothetical protein V1882_10395 [Candidatus Omnitrophota bacterium]